MALDFKRIWKLLITVVSEQRVNLGCMISEFSYLALGQIQKLGEIFLSFRNDLNGLGILGKNCVRISSEKNDSLLVSCLLDNCFGTLPHSI